MKLGDLFERLFSEGQKGMGRLGLGAPHQGHRMTVLLADLDPDKMVSVNHRPKLKA
jgi:hypothetical protein